MILSRSPLATAVAGAVLSVSAVSVAAVDLPAVRGGTSAAVELTALANPLLEIYDTIQKANLYLFSIAEPPVTTFDRAGIIPDTLAAGFPVLTQYFLNAPDYINQTINYLFTDFQQFPTVYPGALRLLTWAVDALPANTLYAAQQLFSGNLVGALETVKFATINPIQAALYQVLNAGLYALGGVGARAAAVITEVADWIPTTIRNIADDATVVLNAVGSVIGNVAFGIQTLNLETIWNALVVGVLGSSPNPLTPTIPDALINQTIGEGGRIYTVPGQPFYIEVNSLRQNVKDLNGKITDALATNVPIPDNPPFPVTLPPLQSQIPTPWNPTPAPLQTPVAASAIGPASTEVTTVAATELPADGVSEAQATGPAAGQKPARSARSERGAANRAATGAEKPGRTAPRAR